VTRDSFHQQLANLEREVVAMGDLARRMLKDSLQALEQGNADLAESVAARAKELAERDERIETQALGILMLQAPVASDLRRIGTVMKLITYLNRVGRYGFDIAKVTKELGQRGSTTMGRISLRQMGRNVERMLDLLLDAYAQHRAPDRAEILALEEEVDAQRAATFREALTYMLEDGKNIEPGAHVMMVARYLERCGDNIVKMAEKQHYAVTGERIILN
jgi:phosphate transport system protein